ncbi:phosphotransferase [Amnibacterium sp.]|uniref:phosphotransferase n=1 Tax=Amnibacterium sp. TaxID=1872496 RepID=UPI003F7C1A84
MQRSSPRPAWAELPADLHGAVEALLGARVVAASSRPGGWSPGTADVLLLDDGRRAFVKTASAAVNATTVDMHRREAAVLAALDASGVAPRLLGAVERDGWIAVAVEHVEGRHPDPRSEEDTAAVLDAVAALPDPVPAAVPPAAADARGELEAAARGWSAVAESGAEQVPGGLRTAQRLRELAAGAGAAVDGEGLVHLDLRPDNILVLPDGRARIVDWPNAVRGAAWLDALTYLLDVRRVGGDVHLRHAVLVDVPPASIDAVLAALAGYFFSAALRPEPPTMAGIRAFQRVEGEAAVDWLRARRPELR